MSAQNLLSGGDKYYSYSGVIQGDVSVPATISMILIPNTGLRDSYIEILPYQGQPVATGVNDGIGIKVNIDDVTIYEDKSRSNYNNSPSVDNTIKLFVPRQSKLEVISINTANNNTQTRGCTLIGYYL
tara:strand:+ start:362 stop:745 length:384 start_codon:yes stop_codon:yes gene_type:complete